MLRYAHALQDWSFEHASWVVCFVESSVTCRVSLRLSVSVSTSASVSVAVSECVRVIVLVSVVTGLVSNSGIVVSLSTCGTGSRQQCFIGVMRSCIPTLLWLPSLVSRVACSRVVYRDVWWLS